MRPFRSSKEGWKWIEEHVGDGSVCVLLYPRRRGDKRWLVRYAEVIPEPLAYVYEVQWEEERRRNARLKYLYRGCRPPYGTCPLP